MELTQEEKKFITELLGKLQFGIDGIEQATFAKNIVIKLNTPISDKVDTKDTSTTS